MEGSFFLTSFIVELAAERNNGVNDFFNSFSLFGKGSANPEWRFRFDGIDGECANLLLLLPLKKVKKGWIAEIKVGQGGQADWKCNGRKRFGLKLTSETEMHWRRRQIEREKEQVNYLWGRNGRDGWFPRRNLGVSPFSPMVEEFRDESESRWRFRVDSDCGCVQKMDGEIILEWNRHKLDRSRVGALWQCWRRVYLKLSSINWTNIYSGSCW